jgi:hypothetical protein
MGKLSGSVTSPRRAVARAGSRPFRTLSCARQAIAVSREATGSRGALVVGSMSITVPKKRLTHLNPDQAKLARPSGGKSHSDERRRCLARSMAANHPGLCHARPCPNRGASRARICAADAATPIYAATTCPSDLQEEALEAP